MRSRFREVSETEHLPNNGEMEGERERERGQGRGNPERRVRAALWRGRDWAARGGIGGKAIAAGGFGGGLLGKYINILYHLYIY